MDLPVQVFTVRFAQPLFARPAPRPAAPAGLALVVCLAPALQRHPNLERPAHATPGPSLAASPSATPSPGPFATQTPVPTAVPSGSSSAGGAGNVAAGAGLNPGQSPSASP